MPFDLEAESIEILREACAGAVRPVMMYSIGKDSGVMLHLARQPAGICRDDALGSGDQRRSRQHRTPRLPHAAVRGALSLVLMAVGL
jgi:hypothetical protein